MIATQKPLTNLQLELLKLYALRLPEAELLEVKQVLAQYVATHLSKHVDELWQKKQLNADDMEQWLNDDEQ
jgi:hypothetical protein